MIDVIWGLNVLYKTKSAKMMINSLMITLYIQSVSACLQEHFDVTDNKRHPGTTLQTSQDATMELCRRACRLIKECYHFNMIWQNPGDNQGTCSILSPNEYGITGMLANDVRATYYSTLFQYFGLKLDQFRWGCNIKASHSLCPDCLKKKNK